MVVSAQGRLRHHFWSNYMATVVLAFDGETQARAALKVLGEPFKIGEGSKRLLSCCVGRGQLDDLKAKLRDARGVKLAVTSCGREHCVGQCSEEEIDGTPHSIDLGPAFMVEVTCEDPRQEDLFAHEHEHVFEIACLGDMVLPCVRQDDGCRETRTCKGCLLCQFRSTRAETR